VSLALEVTKQSHVTYSIIRKQEGNDSSRCRYGLKLILLQAGFRLPGSKRTFGSTTSEYPALEAFFPTILDRSRPTVILQRLYSTSSGIICSLEVCYDVCYYLSEESTS